MYSLSEKVMSFIRDEEGLTTVEYAIAGSLVGLAVVVAFTNLGSRVNNAITQLGTAINK